MLRAVVFDAVGTLMTPAPPAGDVYHAVGRRWGSQRSLDDVRRRFLSAFRSRLQAVDTPEDRACQTSERDEWRFWESVVSSVYDELSSDSRRNCFDELFEHFRRAESWHVYPDVGPALAELRRRGLKLAVASNFDARLHSVFAGQPELASIDDRFVSSEMGWRKPSPRFFATVCERLGHPPHEVLYVGDEPVVDVEAAGQAGLPSLLLDRGRIGRQDSLSNLRELSTWIDRDSAPTPGGTAP